MNEQKENYYEWARQHSMRNVIAKKQSITFTFIFRLFVSFHLVSLNFANNDRNSVEDRNYKIEF